MSSTSGIFELNAGTTLASADVLVFVDVSDSTQAPQGSTLKITAANFFGTIPSQLSVALGTVTVSTPILQGTATWNDGAVTFTALDLNITSTASAVASLLANLRVGGTSQWKVTRGGGVTQTGALAIVGAFTGATTIAASTSVTVTSASAVALTVGLAGATNPAFTVDSSTATQAAGLKVTGAATGGTVALVVTDSGAAANLTINALGTGTIGIGSVSTGRVTITPVVTITGALTQTGLATFNGGATVASGQTLTLTGATITGTPAWSSNQAITLSTAAQPNVTSVGTLTTLATSGLYTANVSNGVQALFKGYSIATASAGTTKGSIQFGDTQADAGQISYDDAANTIFYIDNTYNNNSSQIQLRLRTQGNNNATTVVGLALTPSLGTFAGGITMNGTLSNNGNFSVSSSGAVSGATTIACSSTLTTGDPGSGAGAWKFGTYLAATVALDTAHYVEVLIGGTLRKLAIVT